MAFNERAGPAAPASARGAIGLALGAALGLAGCGGLFGVPEGGGGAGPSGGASAAAARPAAPPLSHTARRFLADYGERRFLVDVRYVGIISESVIAVRELTGEPPSGYEPIDLASGPAAEDAMGAPFRGSETEELAEDIAARVAALPEVCGSGREMSLSTNEDGEPRTLYRDAQQAWVVFTACRPSG